MSYPGNEALGEETKARLLRTFAQTIDLAARGGIQEALLGCDFILRMDPLFQPAAILHERLSASSGTVEVDDLRMPAAADPAPAPPTYGTMQIPAMPPTAASPPARPAVVEPPPVDPQAVRAALQRAFDKRDFSGVVTAAAQHSALVANDPVLRPLAEAAQAHAEAEPYIRRFLDEARAALRHGDAAEAQKLLQKAAALDATHPEIAEIQALMPVAPPPDLEPALALEDFPSQLAGESLAEELPDEMSFADFAAPTTEFTPGAPQQETMPSLQREGTEIPLSAGAPARTSESDSRIGELLTEGQAALERGEYQGAIDAWSRIFLIDIDHAEAARRIEQARKLKAEAERKIEELFHEGAARYEAADAEGAKAIFEQVLAQQPGHLAAREYLEQIEAGKVRAAARPTGALKPAAKAPEPAAVLKEEILVPPEPGAAPKGASKSAALPAAGAKKASRPLLPLVGAAVLVVAAAAGWYLFTHRERFFPNSKPAAVTTPQQIDAIARATALHGQGKTAVAIAQLRRLPQDDPQYEKAQALITQWQAAEQPQPQKQQPSTEEQARRDLLLEQARAAYSDRQYLHARQLFDDAEAIATLDGTAAELRDDARKQVEPLQRELSFFQQGEYEIALHDLWRMHESDAGNRDVTQLMVSAYYNLGVKDLQREAPTDAIQKFKDGLGIDARDAQLLRLARFAGVYQNRGPDLQYRIFVKYLAMR